MNIDDAIIRKFVDGEITTKAMKLHLIEQLNAKAAASKAMATAVSAVASRDPDELMSAAQIPSFSERARTVDEYASKNLFYLDDWEKEFLQSCMDEEHPSEKMINRFEKIWKRFQRATSNY